MAVAWLAFAFSPPAFSADEPAAPAAPAAPTETPVQLSQLEFAPVRVRPNFGGSIDYTLRRDSIAGRKTRSQALNVAVNAGVDVNSFIWQPWFAQVSGGLGIRTYLTDNDYNTGASTTSTKTVSSVITGKVAMDVVPLSRFPFRTYYERDDNRQNVGFNSANSASKTTRFGLSQQYRTLSGQTNYAANYDQSRFESVSSNVSKQRQTSVSMTTSLSANQGLTVSGNSNFNEQVGSNQSTLSNTVVARHNYRPRADLSVENLANMGRTNYRLVQGENIDKYTQLSSFASWSSSSDRPVTVSGSARVSQYDNSTPITSSSQSSASANLGASYQMSKRVRTYGSAGININDDKNSGTQTISSNEAAGAEYRSELMDLGSFRYGTHVSGNVSNNTAPAGSTRSTSVSAGHALSRSTATSARVRFDTHLDQTATASKTTHSPSSTNLAHSGSLAWTIAGDGGNTGLRLNASDSRTLSSPRSYFQLANLQLTRSQGVTRNTSLSGDLTLQATRQGTEGAPKTPTANTSSASLNYIQQRVFSVPRLNFNSELRFYSDSLVPTMAGPNGRESRSWNNHLRYSIGRLNLILDANLAESNKVKSSALIFRLNRAF